MVDADMGMDVNSSTTNKQITNRKQPGEIPFENVMLAIQPVI